jgi:ABC-type sulfate/molybdate transport systems ATPase subunit
VDLVVDRWPLLLLGSSGAGKTQLLRTLAGLGPRAEGRIELDGVVWLDDRTHVPPHRRSVGFCVQEGELFPHLSVLANVAYPLRFRTRLSRAEREELARDWLARLRVDHLASSSPSAVSGGERGRIALARALVAEPSLLLADEPFAALDPVQRNRLGGDVIRNALQGRRVVWVTHDPAEAELLSQGGTRLRLDRGRIVEGR